MNEPTVEQSPTAQLETYMRHAVARGLQAGVNPVAMIGLLECIKSDVRDNVIQGARAAARHQIIRANGLPKIHG